MIPVRAQQSNPNDISEIEIFEITEADLDKAQETDIW